jgi:hypothetical protein
MLHVGPMLVYDVFAELMASQNNMEQWKPGDSTNRNDESFFVTKFARKWNIMTRSATNVINKWRWNVIVSLVNYFL